MSGFVVDVTYDDAADLMGNDTLAAIMMTPLPFDLVPSSIGDGKLTVTFHSTDPVRDMSPVLTYLARVLRRPVPSGIVCEPDD